VGTRASWCDDAWCYVDGCACNLTDVQGGPLSYFDNSDGTEIYTAYSYMACQGVGSTYDGGTYDKEALCNEKCKCISLPNTIPRAACDSPHAVNGMCFVAAGKNYAKYPGDFGASCKKHHETGTAACYNLTTGEELPVGTRASWCDDLWCYVDGCTCDLTDVQGGPLTYFHKSDGTEVFAAYSYMACQDAESTYDGGTNHKEACEGVTCGEVRDHYRHNACCGAPDKRIPKMG